MPVPAEFPLNYVDLLIVRLYLCAVNDEEKYKHRREKTMTQHTSLRSVTKIIAKRNVMKRFERIDVMRARGTWKDGDRALGLPKSKPQV